MNQIEIWKDIENYEGLYQISNTEKARSLTRTIKHKNGSLMPFKGRIIKFRKDKDGYLIFDLHKEGKAKTVRAHRIVAIAFVPNPLNKPEVNHKDGVRINIKPENLEWATRSENNLHAFRVLKRKPVCANTGRTGYANKKSKPIIQMYLNGNFVNDFGSAMEAMRLTGIRQGCISKVANGVQYQTGGYKWQYKSDYECK